MLLWAFASAAAEGIYHSALVFEMGRLELRERTREGEGGKVLPMCVCVCVCVCEGVGGWVYTLTRIGAAKVAQTRPDHGHMGPLSVSLYVCAYIGATKVQRTRPDHCHMGLRLLVLDPGRHAGLLHTMSHHHTYYVTSSYVLCHIIIRTMSGSYWTPDVMQVSFAIF